MRLLAFVITLVTLAHCSCADHFRALQEQGEPIVADSGEESVTNVDDPKPSNQTSEDFADWQQELLMLVNWERAKVNLPAVCLNAKLNAAAQGHADDMAAKNYFSHYSPDGRDAVARMTQQGYAAPGAENIAAGQTTPNQVMNMWMSDPGRRDNILGKLVKHIGLGRGYSASSQYKYYWVQDFGSSTTEQCISNPPTNPPTTKPPTNPPTTAPPSSDWQKQLLALVNLERARVGLPALCLNAKLNAAAQGHATDMAIKNYFSHYSLDGTDPFTRMRRQGYSSGSAENIAAGQITPQEVMNAWMNSPGHRANILSNARQLGVGKGYNLASTFHYYWVQNFGTSLTEPCLAN